MLTFAESLSAIRGLLSTCLDEDHDIKEWNCEWMDEVLAAVPAMGELSHCSFQLK